jgi:hypothetical protein
MDEEMTKYGEEPAPPPPLTRERLEEDLRESQWAFDLQAVTNQLEADMRQLSSLKLGSKLVRAGGMQMNEAGIRSSTKIVLDRIRILREMRLKLEDHRPLANPPGMAVVENGGIVVPGVELPAGIDLGKLGDR